MNTRGRVLIVDDEKNILKTLSICLEGMNFGVCALTDPVEAVEQLETTGFDMAFLDLRMAPISGIELLEEIKRRTPEVTVVIMTAYSSVDTAVDALKKGAYDYIEKPFNLRDLRHFIEKVYEHHRLQAEVKALKSQLKASTGPEPIITGNARMKTMLDLALQVADSPLSVLINGESGTGKEVFAQFIHHQSARRDKPLVKVNCVALSENLLESELFGHVKGAFTGATRDRQGRFELADGGTIFLDEIAEISPGLQAKLLRFLQSREFERVGDSRTIKVDVRVIAATNRNLEEVLKNGTFREDLYYRLNAVRMTLLPLRERQEDIPLLIRHFLRALSQSARTEAVEVSPDVMRLLVQYPWPGNVRELRNVLERAFFVAAGREIMPTHLPEELQRHESPVEQAMRQHLSLEELEKQYIEYLLKEVRDLDTIASILKIDPTTLWRKRKRYGLM
ncbi:MAG: sigma-54-dependent Fis family transcriptional regulator [Candidatus Latescibacteria bacterium]|nr:sigma-54-dependent Fis family transcriptional regulator [Candidatus Latescibacterota bacterium]